MELKTPMSTLTPTVANLHLTAFSNQIPSLKSHAVIYVPVPLRPSGFLFDPMSLFLGFLSLCKHIFMGVSMYILGSVLLCPSIPLSAIPSVSHN